MNESEWLTRKSRIDKRLSAANLAWKIIPYRDGLDCSQLTGHAVTEFPTANGPADYALFAHGSFLGIIPEHLKQKIRNYTVKANDVYITIVGACIGDAGVIPEKMDGANLTENAAKITGLVGCIASFMAGWLRSPITQRLIQTNTLSAAQGKLALFRIEQLPLPLPPLPEQQEIVLRVEALFALADQLEARFAKAQSQVDKLTPSLLARAFRGQLVRQDPNDEPASALLERIGREPRGTSKPTINAIE